MQMESVSTYMLYVVLHEEEEEVVWDHVLSAYANETRRASRRRRRRRRTVVLALRNQLRLYLTFFRHPPREVWHVLKTTYHSHVSLRSVLQSTYRVHISAYISYLSSLQTVVYCYYISFPPPNLTEPC